MNPIQHGEVFVTDDGTETDLDLGHYERFIDESLDRNSNVTTGKDLLVCVCRRSAMEITAEGRCRSFLILQMRLKAAFTVPKSPDEERIAIIEVGGTAGDIESQPFLEAIRQFQHDVGHENADFDPCDIDPLFKSFRRTEDKTHPGQC